MCEGDANGATNGEHPARNPDPSTSIYQSVGDYLSNTGRFSAYSLVEGSSTYG